MPAVTLDEAVKMMGSAQKTELLTCAGDSPGVVMDILVHRDTLNRAFGNIGVDVNANHEPPEILLKITLLCTRAMFKKLRDEAADVLARSTSHEWKFRMTGGSAIQHITLSGFQMSMPSTRDAAASEPEGASKMEHDASMIRAELTLFPYDLNATIEPAIAYV